MKLPDYIKERIPQFALVAVTLAGGVFLLAAPGCRAPKVSTDAMRPLIEIMDERVDAYVEADDTLDEAGKSAALIWGDAALLLVAEEGGKVEAAVLRGRVEPLWALETSYTLADTLLAPRVQAALLRNGLLVITTCTRAEGRPDPAMPEIPGLPEPPAVVPPTDG